MYIVASFEQSLYIELAVTQLEQKGICRRDILAVPLDKTYEERKIFDTIHSSDGISLFDAAAALGTAFMVLGTIYGFVLKWGPVICGLAGLLLGAGIGFLLDISLFKKPGVKNKNKIHPEVVLIVNCEEEQESMVKKVLRDHNAFGIGLYKG